MPIAISIAAPAYNEADCIEAVVRGWWEYLAGRPEWGEFEIVICNDGSRDETGAILERLAATYPQVRPVHQSPNQGAAAALARAIAHTRGEWVLLTDTDGQFPVENLVALRAGAAAGAEAVMGVRAKQDSRWARWGSAASGWMCNRIYGTRYRDFNSAFKWVSGPLVRDLHLEARGLNYSTEITAKLIERGATLVEVEIEHQRRQGGASSRRWWKSSVDRAAFVGYLAARRWLWRRGVLRSA